MARIRYFNIRIAKTANFLLHQFWECRIVYELPRWYLAYKYYTCVVSIMILARWSVLWMPMCGRARGDGDAVVQQQAKAHKVAGTRFLSRGPAPPVLPPDFPQQPARSGLIPTTCVLPTMCGAKWQVSITQVDHQIRPNTWQPPDSRQHPLHPLYTAAHTL